MKTQLGNSLKIFTLVLSACTLLACGSELEFAGQDNSETLDSSSALVSLGYFDDSLRSDDADAGDGDNWRDTDSEYPGDEFFQQDSSCKVKGGGRVHPYCGGECDDPKKSCQWYNGHKGFACKCQLKKDDKESARDN